MKLTTGLLLVGIAAGSAWAQNLDVIDNTRSTMNAVVRKKAIDSDAALAPQSSPQAAPASANTASGHTSPYKAPAKIRAAAMQKSKAAKAPAASKEQVAVQNSAIPSDTKKDENKQISLTGHRDPFVSPVVNSSMLGSGCSTGKKCLAVDQISLKGVIRSQSGMIAIVVNALDKAYFLHENDPVFNGYVVRITGDSIIFKETTQDKLGKNFTREVTKKIFTPAV